jgi:hypothetical protein
MSVRLDNEKRRIHAGDRADARAWSSALEEHQHVVHGFVAECARVPVSEWHRAPAPGAWSASEVALHLCAAYELGRAAVHGGPGMRMLVTPTRAWVLRSMLLPLMLASKRFPHGVPAPREVVPDADASRRLPREAAIARLERSAREAAEELQRASDQHPDVRVTHAYFGPLTARAALRLLSAHTRHHTRGLAASQRRGLQVHARADST